MSQSKPAPDLDPAVDTQTAAAFLGLEPKTLVNWRHKGGGPDYYKYGRSIRAQVRYSMRVLTEFREQGRRRSTSEAAP